MELSRLEKKIKNKPISFPNYSYFCAAIPNEEGDRHNGKTLN